MMPKKLETVSGTPASASTAVETAFMVLAVSCFDCYPCPGGAREIQSDLERVPSYNINTGRKLMALVDW